MAKNLVIVESPTKARTIAKLLGASYQVKASLGHVRDLPKSRLGVKIDEDFTPQYLVPKNKKALVKELTKVSQEANAIYLATDPDREGEAISWHLIQAAKLEQKPTLRVVFHEFTPEAISEAFRQPRALDMHLVNAQQARRILDRLVGYKISPLLWQKVRRGLSAGRVQSVALRIIVDRERQIQSFIPVEYWTIEAELAKLSVKGESTFRAALVSLWDEKSKIEISNQPEAQRLASLLESANYEVAKLQKKDARRQPQPPFTTSTLQQEAWRQLRFTAKRTMATAQQLYEGLHIGPEGEMGLITYMRSDSTHVAASALAETRDYIGLKYGLDFLPSSPRRYTRKTKGAQEAHEAIRPTSVKREPALIKPFLSPDQFRLYDLIWRRMVASQMAAAVLTTATIDIKAHNPTAEQSYLLRASRSQFKFLGFVTVYKEAADEEKAKEKEKPLPELNLGEPLRLIGLSPEQHFTQPPPRYTEASLIKALEENGIGRPSTYAPTLSTLQERGYVEKTRGHFQPKELGIIVCDLLSEHFPDIVDIGFTAQMEEELDEIARGEREWVPMLRGFYQPFSQMVEGAAQHMPKLVVADEPTEEICEKCGRPMVIKRGRYGRFIACTGYPECKNTKPFTLSLGVSCPECGGQLVEKRTKTKRIFYGCSRYPSCTFSTWQRPLSQPCPQCGGLMTLYRKNSGRCQKCGYSGPIEEETAERQKA
ncbi:MAG: type I DNA topoisomerase [Chloroflexi bacterium]|nr:type I DNA topoisomerase [Chloroflexota bacterium]